MDFKMTVREVQQLTMRSGQPQSDCLGWDAATANTKGSSEWV